MHFHHLLFLKEKRTVFRPEAGKAVRNIFYFFIEDCTFRSIRPKAAVNSGIK